MKPPQSPSRASQLDTEAMKSKLKSLILRIRIERDFQKQRQIHFLAERTRKLKEISQLFEEKKKSFLEDVSLRPYAPYMKTNDVPSYLVILQSKVLRNLHHLSVIEDQKAVVDRQSATLASNLRRQILYLKEEKTALELKLVNHMAMIQDEERRMHEAYTSLLSRQSVCIEIEKRNETRVVERGHSQIGVVGVLEAEKNVSSGDLGNDMKRRDGDDDDCGNVEAPKQSRQRPQKKRSISLRGLLHIEGKNKVSKHESLSDLEDDSSNSARSHSNRMSLSFSHLIWKDKQNRVVSV